MLVKLGLALAAFRISRFSIGRCWPIFVELSIELAREDDEADEAEGS